MIDFVTSSASSRDSDKAAHMSGMQSALAVCYLCCFHFVAYSHDMADTDGYSFFLFLGATVQAMGVLSLCLKVKGTRSVEGLSSQSLLLFTISVASRLVCTMVFDGYLSADNTGDILYQMADLFTLVCLSYLLYSIHKLYAHTYQKEQDDLPVRNLLLACAALATCVHGNLNRSPVFDALWAFSLNVEVVQMLPQICMLAKVGGIIDRTTAHFVANMFLSCLLRIVFWVWAIPGCEDLSSPDGFSWDMQLSGAYILGAHILELIVLLDFMYYYVKAMRKGSAVYLPKMEMTVV
jgi:hypothetical protein